jgi:hypothetical protein
MNFGKNNQNLVLNKKIQKRKAKFLCMVQVSGQKYIGLSNFFFYIFMDDHHFNYITKLERKNKN